MKSAVERELIAHIHELFNSAIPFNRILGMKVDHLDEQHVVLRLDMRDELIGNFLVGSLHGGVISSLLDTAGGLSALLGMFKNHTGVASVADLKVFRKLATIDMRIDYLRPGLGAYFLASSFILRAGKRVSVTRMELHNDKKTLIAVGTATYIVS